MPAPFCRARRGGGGRRSLPTIDNFAPVGIVFVTVGSVWCGGAVDVLDAPLVHPSARDGAVRDFKRHLKAERRKPTTVNNHLAALADFYERPSPRTPLSFGVHEVGGQTWVVSEVKARA